MIQPIYLFGSEVLRKRAEEVDLAKKDEIKALVQDLKDTLANADGCGLAAPQIGVSKRVVIVDGTGMEDVYDYLKDFRRTLINPVIIEESDRECEYNEGCLSIPGIFADVRRPDSITVEYYDAICRGVNSVKLWPMALWRVSPWNQGIPVYCSLKLWVDIWPVTSGSSMPVCSPRP